MATSIPKVDGQNADNATADLAHRGDRQIEPDIVEKFFLNSQRPIVALFAISICLVGVMDFLPKTTYDPETWSDDVDSVNGFYGPGVIISWCLMSLSMLYDANQVYKTKADSFHYDKYATIIFSGIWALGDAVWRALHMDFGPSYAAALYMSDKGFELGTLLFTIYLFPIHRMSQSAQHPVAPPDVEVARQGETPSFRTQATAAIEQYKIYPCVAMVSVWVWCRALANGHAVYCVKAQNPSSVVLSWDPLLAPYWKPILVSASFSLTYVFAHQTSWGWWSWGLPVSILLSFALMHSGLFGSYTPLRLTTIEITETDQMAAIISTLLVLIVQYGRQILSASTTFRKLKACFER